MSAARKWKPTPDAHANDNGHKDRVTSFSAAELQPMKFAPINYTVPNYIADGLTLFVGNPKIGKSWLDLDIAINVATGGHCLGQQCVQGDVLYLALEDNARRLQSRFQTLMPQFSIPASKWPANLQIEIEWPRADAGGLKAIEIWLDAHPNARLVIVDVLAMFRPLGTNKNAYEQDYLAIKGLQGIAMRRNVAVLVTHHTRKAASDSGDPLETVSGTMGLSGAADSILVLRRDSKGTTLFCRGRDIEQVESAVMFDKQTCKWRMLGNAEDVHRSDQRNSILSLLIDAAEPITPDKIVRSTGMNKNAVNQLLHSMKASGEVQVLARGQYVHPDRSDLLPSIPPPNKKGKKVSKRRNADI